MHAILKYFTIRRFKGNKIMVPLGAVIVLLYIIRTPERYRLSSPEKDVIHSEEGDLPLLYRDVVPIVNDKNVFMLETSETHTLSSRVLCSLESYIKMNPTATFWFVVRAKRLDAMTINYLNSIRVTYEIELKVVSMVTEEVLQDTPLRKLLDAPGFWKSKFLVHNLSNMCRLAIVFKSGGLYSDTDIVNYNSISHLKNFLVRQTSSFVNNGVFHLEAGHPFLMETMNYVLANSDINQYGSTGPRAITGSIKRYCDTTPLTPEDSIQYFNYVHEGICNRKESDGFEPPKIQFSCNKLSIFHDVAMYPINTSKFTLLFNETAETICLSQLMQVSYGIHLSNKISAKASAKKDSAINQLASSCCPTVFSENSGKVY